MCCIFVLKNCVITYFLSVKRCYIRTEITLLLFIECPSLLIFCFSLWQSVCAADSVTSYVGSLQHTWVLFPDHLASKTSCWHDSCAGLSPAHMEWSLALPSIFKEAFMLFSCRNWFFPLLCIFWLVPHCFLGCRSLHHHRSALKKGNSGLLAINALRSVAADCLCIHPAFAPTNPVIIIAKGSITFCKRTVTTLRWLMPG